MKWANVRRIFQRELRDQLRDRRTLFTIAILPLMLYPLLGMTLLQVAQFNKEHPTNVGIVGLDELPADPPLLQEGKFNLSFCSEDEGKLLALALEEQIPAEILEAIPESGNNADNAELNELQTRLAIHDFDALIYFPEGFRSSLENPEQFRSQNGTPPEIQIYLNSAKDKSRMANDRLKLILARWRQFIVDSRLTEKKVTDWEREPFKFAQMDMASEEGKRAAIWSRILPFIVLVWALTGAFYPAIDLCAGEKERGTLETLLVSPAMRSEIVIGKLLTIMSFSIATSALNLLSMGLTGIFLLGQLNANGDGAMMDFGPPPVSAFGWLAVILIPIAALFGSLSLAVASFAKSSKEGQYYLMPLLMIALPLMMLPMLPAAELSFGSSLIPVTGLMLLMRSFIEGRYLDAAPYILPVVGITLVCCTASVRWAIRQFNNESVLFRESERIGLGTWLKSLMRDRGPLPTFGQAILCGIIILMLRFYGSAAAGMPVDFLGFAKITVIGLIAFVAAPAMFMAIFLTTNPLKTLLLDSLHVRGILAAVLLALLLHPTSLGIGFLVQTIFPFNPELLEFNKQIASFLDGVPFFYVLLVLAFAPAVLEELTFRGFVLSGLYTEKNKWQAIIVSSMFFGVAHLILQQSITATLTGCVLGFIAVQTRSIFPCIAFHFVHNGMSLSLVKIAENVDKVPGLNFVMNVSKSQTGEITDVGYGLFPAILMGMMALGILYWFWTLKNTLNDPSLKSEKPSSELVT